VTFSLWRDTSLAFPVVVFNCSEEITGREIPECPTYRIHSLPIILTNSSPGSEQKNPQHHPARILIGKKTGWLHSLRLDAVVFERNVHMSQHLFPPFPDNPKTYLIGSQHVMTLCALGIYYALFQLRRKVCLLCKRVEVNTMKQSLKASILIFAFSFAISSAWATPVSGPHLWLSTDPNNFDEGGLGYVGNVSDPWLTESYVTIGSPFTLYVYHPVGDAAIDIGLMVAVHDGEIGTVVVDGTVISTFPNTDISPYYGGGNHGIYQPHDGVFAVYQTEIDLLADTNHSPSVLGAVPGSFTSFEISWDGFSQIHVDAFSANGFWNPPSHDATGIVPELATAVLLGTGLVGIAATGWRSRKKVTTGSKKS